MTLLRGDNPNVIKGLLQYEQSLSKETNDLKAKDPTEAGSL
jgi:hypothetical protein